MPKDTLTVTDNRTGKSYELPITDGTIRALDLRAIKVDDHDFGLLSYDPAYLNTASCRSSITFIDGDRGILRYRGYDVAELAEKSTYLEVAYLVMNGELPTRAELQTFSNEITVHTFLHENARRFIDGFRYDAHPMGVLIATAGALSTFYPDAKSVHEPEVRRRNMIRLMAKMPTIAAWSYRHSMGYPMVYPDNSLSYPGNLLSMMKRMAEARYEPNPIIEQNCSTAAIRAVGSSLVDPYSAVAAAAAALYGPLHGGANEAVLRMLMKIGSVKNVPGFIQEVKTGGGERLMGFGHRVYKNYDPRAKVIKKLADDVFKVTGRSPLLDIALELEKIALSDEYFIKRKLYPNVDFYSGLIYQAIGFPLDMFPVLFAIPRTVGWLAQWEEMLLDGEQKIARPRQIYTGASERKYVALERRAPMAKAEPARG